MSDLEPVELIALARHLDGLRREQLGALTAFRAEKAGFRRTALGSASKMSEVSTATAILSILRAFSWDEWTAHLAKLGVDPTAWASGLLEERLMSPRAQKSSITGNKPNPYTVAFLTEAAFELHLSRGVCSTRTHNRLAEARKYLVDALLSGSEPTQDEPQQEPGSISIQYPPSAHMTQLAVRVILKLDGHLSPDDTLAMDEVWAKVEAWSLRNTLSQLALLTAGSHSADPYELAYASMIFAAVAKNLTPDQKLVVSRAVDCVFERQRNDGLWERSYPIFHHPKVGTAYSYEFEMLAQALQVQALAPNMSRHLSGMRLAVQAADRDAFSLSGYRSWSSGHIPQQASPESWATASVYHFAFNLSRVVPEVLARGMFERVGLDFRRPETVVGVSSLSLADGLGKIPMQVNGVDDVARVLQEQVVVPIRASSDLVARGVEMPESTPASLLLHGPPGTGKTSLAEKLAGALGWPLLSLDPSHLGSGGLDRVQMEANTLFSSLLAMERIVVLLDEFDELMRSRADGELLSRFLTTAMLPKMAAMNRRRRVLLIVATNHPALLDSAITRAGRFDAILPVLAPSSTTKREALCSIDRLGRYAAATLSPERAEADNMILGMLTMSEAKSLNRRLDGVPDDGMIDALHETWKVAAALRYLREIPMGPDADGPADDLLPLESEAQHLIRLYSQELAEYTRLPNG